MKRNWTLVRKKYIEYLISTMAFSLSIYLAVIVDGILVGRLLGPKPFSAINMTMPVVYIKNIVFSLFIYGATTMVSQFLGSRDKKNCNAVYSLAIKMGTLSSSLLAAAGIILASPTATFLSRNTTLYTEVYEYLIPLWVVGPLVVLSSGSAAFLRLEGKHKLATALPVTANAVNLCCDYIFIKWLGWGIAGAGWATATGYAFSLVLLIPHFKDKNRQLYLTRLSVEDLKHIPECFKVGLPIALIHACNVLRFYSINTIVDSKLGDSGSQIISVCNSSINYATMLAEGAATAMSNVCGTLYGERDRKGIGAVLKFAATIAGAACIVIFALLELFPQGFAMIYKVSDPETLSLIGVYLRLYSVYVLFLGPVYLFRCFYQSTKQPGAATLLSALEGAVFLVPLFYGFSLISPAVMWLANSVSALLALVTVISYMSYRAGKEGFTGFLMLSRKDDKDETLEFSISCTEKDAVSASEYVGDFLKRKGLLSKIEEAMMISAEELCVNITRFAGLNSRSQIDLFLRITDDCVLLKVRDTGKPFNPAEFIGEKGEHITGLSLIRSLGCTIEYDRIIGFNTTIVSFELPSSDVNQ